jgi:hypothetical protein
MKGWLSSHAVADEIIRGNPRESKFAEMMMEIIRIVLVPIGAALLHDFPKRPSTVQKRKIYTISMICAVWLLIISLDLYRWFAGNLSGAGLQSISMLCFFAGAVPAGVLYHQLYRRFPVLTSWCGISRCPASFILQLSPLRPATTIFFVSASSLRLACRTAAWPVVLPEPSANWARSASQLQYSVHG